MHQVLRWFARESEALLSLITRLFLRCGALLHNPLYLINAHNKQSWITDQEKQGGVAMGYQMLFLDVRQLACWIVIIAYITAAP